MTAHLPVRMRFGAAPEQHVGDLEIDATTTGADLVDRMPALLCRVAAEIDPHAGPVGLVNAWEHRAAALEQQAADATRGDLEDRVRARGLTSRASTYRAFALELRHALGLPDPDNTASP